MYFVENDEPVIEMRLYFPLHDNDAFSIRISGICRDMNRLLDIIRKLALVSHEDIGLIDERPDLRNNLFACQSTQVRRIDFLKERVTNTGIQIPGSIGQLFQSPFVEELEPEIVLNIGRSHNNNSLCDTHLLHISAHFFGNTDGTAGFS